MDRAVVHGSTVAKNNMAMVAGLVTINVIDDECLVENAATVENEIIAAVESRTARYEFLKAVRGKGLMIAIDFGSPQRLVIQDSLEPSRGSKQRSILLNGNNPTVFQIPYFESSGWTWNERSKIPSSTQSR